MFLWLGIVLGGLAFSQAAAAAPGESIQEIVGFQVVTMAGAASDPQLISALARLTSQLENVRTVAPVMYSALSAKVKIWISDSRFGGSAAAYNPSTAWLQQHGRDPRLAKGVELIDVDKFLAWSVPSDQPMMILHELTHAYHDQILGEDNPAIHAAYENAVASGKYEHVPYHDTNGPLLRAYALTNEQEYFAEISEAYFGRNDYFPFNRSDLQSFDPAGFALVARFLDR